MGNQGVGGRWSKSDRRPSLSTAHIKVLGGLMIPKECNRWHKQTDNRHTVITVIGLGLGLGLGLGVDCRDLIID